MSSPASLTLPSHRLRGARAAPHPSPRPAGQGLDPTAGGHERGAGWRRGSPRTLRRSPPQQGALRRGAATSPRALGASAAGAAGGSPGRPFSPPPFLSFASPPSRPVSAALPPLPPPSPIGREGRSRRLFPASLQTSAGLASPLAAATVTAPPARELLLELPPAARPGHPGGWKDAAGRRAAAARTVRSPASRLPGLPLAPLPRCPPARASVGPSFLATSPLPAGSGHQASPPRPAAARDFSLCWMRTRAPRRRGAA